VRFIKPTSGGAYIKCGLYNDTGCLTLSDLLHQEIDYTFLSAGPGRNTARLHKCRDKRALAKKISLDFLSLLLDDLIATGNIFLLPVQQGAQIKIVAKTRKAVRSIIRRKAYSAVDFMESDFKVYEFVLDYKIQGDLRRRYLRVNQDRYAQMVDRVNKGQRYFDGFF